MMRLTGNRRIFIKILVSAVIICMTPLCEKGRMLNGARSSTPLAGKELVCAIDLGNDMYGSHGLETGFHYELLKKFSHDNRCDVRIVAAEKGDNYRDSLMKGKIDILVTHPDDSISGIRVSRKVNDCSVWAVRKSSGKGLMLINKWIGLTVISSDYQRLQSRFFRTYNPHKRVEMGHTTNIISPYDDLLHKYAGELGWDWRMLAALIYQESKFAINSESHRGAQGLMQVMPRTGIYYGTDNLLDPEANIKAGTMHLKRLQNIFRKHDLEHEELVKFTLAAYNAGEGRISDCRHLAALQQVDSTRWDEVKSIIPLMREDSILQEPVVKHGKFNGSETIAYVDSVLSLYEAFCTICPQI